MDVIEKNYVEKHLLTTFSTEDEGSHTDQITRISVRSLTLLIFAVGWALCGRTRVSDGTAVTLSVKYFNLLKLCPLSGNIFRKWFASYFYLFTSI